MAAYYKDLGDKIKLIVEVGSRKNRKSRTKTVKAPTGRRREREKRIQEMVDRFEA